MVADVGVDAVGKVDGRRPGGEVDDVPLRGEDEDLVGKHVDLQIVHEVLRVRLLLALEQAAHPGELVLIPLAQRRAPVAHLVLPVRGDAVFGGVVHVPGADLHLEGDALRADDRRVHALVHIGLGCGDIVLEAPGDGLEHIVDQAEHVIAVRDRAHDHAEGAEVEDPVHVQLLRVHLAVDGVDVFDAAEDRAVEPLGLQPRLDLRLHAVHEGLQRGHLRVEPVGDLLVALRVEVLQRQILQLPLGLLHAEAVGDGGVDLHRLKGLGALLLRRLIGHGAHVVQTVGDLDEDDADVLGHRHEHLAQILHLLLFLGRVLHARQLGDALHDVRDGRAEAVGNVGVGHAGVLDHVMQQRRDDRVLVQPKVNGDVRRRDAVRHVGRAVLAHLPGVRRARHIVGGADALHVHGVAARADLLLQLREHHVRVKRGIRFSHFLSHGRVLTIVDTTLFIKTGCAGRA